MPANPVQLLAAGRYNHGPVLVGTNKNEFGLFQALTGTIQTAASFRRWSMRNSASSRRS